MKKKYIYPSTTRYNIVIKENIATPTGVNGGGSGSDIGYGGTDDDGEIDPSSKERMDDEFFESLQFIESESDKKYSLW